MKARGPIRGDHEQPWPRDLHSGNDLFGRGSDGLEGASVLVLMERAAGGGAPRLEDGPELPARMPRGEGAQGLLDRGRVVREVVVDGDAVRPAEEILSPAYAFERSERSARRSDRDAEAFDARRERAGWSACIPLS